MSIDGIFVSRGSNVRRSPTCRRTRARDAKKGCPSEGPHDDISWGQSVVQAERVRRGEQCWDEEEGELL